MSIQIRKARPEDAQDFLAIKASLPMPSSDGTTQSGGFLLGTDETTYRFFIEHGMCLVAETSEGVVGFGILLPDAMVRASDVWQRRKQAQWHVDLRPYESMRLGYVEQLAFLPGHRKSVIALAYNLICWAFESGCEVLFTTTVREPVLNLAAVPLIFTGGGIHAGSIDEWYPSVGRILSDIYLLEPAAFWSHTSAHKLHGYFEQQRVRLT